MKGNGRVLIQCAIMEFIGRDWQKSLRILSRELNPEPPGYKVASLPYRPQSTTSGRLRILFQSQETEASSFLCQGHGSGWQCVFRL